MLPLLQLLLKTIVLFYCGLANHYDRTSAMLTAHCDCMSMCCTVWMTQRGRDSMSLDPALACQQKYMHCWNTSEMTSILIPCPSDPVRCWYLQRVLILPYPPLLQGPICNSATASLVLSQTCSAWQVLSTCRRILLV